ncbi:uncharacterized protein LOC122575381 isoform X2 [Bombus pyrosoma]|uniref:uncharacterized protein LOC122575381 isoform X2 n=1 Tax=Bombus pyrosoma TaxID=396416 RepID=UPI001CB95216|nr:uncharacterized protein LOC122575381 isoform X2 [Bombus pyrosoma]
MASIDSKKVTDVEVQNASDISTSEVIPTNTDQNPNTPIIAKVDEETVVSSDLFAYDPAKYSFCKKNSIVSILKVGESGTLEFQPEIRNGVYSITLWPDSANSDYQHFLEELAVVIPEATQWKSRRPNIGDFVFGKCLDGEWIRGYVIFVLPYLKVAMIDEGRLLMATELATCKKPLSDMYAFSGVCELTDATHEFEEGEMSEFKVTGRTDNVAQDEFEILILKGDFEIKATVKPWIPTPEQLGLPCGDVTNGTTVCLTGYQNHIQLYIRPLDTLAPFLRQPPYVADMVLALAADGNYYRAFVTNVENDRVEVTYHDLGRSDYVDTKTLKIFPDCLKKLGYAMTKVQLKDVPPDIPPLIPIIEYLDSLIETKVPLICTYDGIPTSDGVYLKYPDGETVNNMICKCLEPYRVKSSE